MMTSKDFVLLVALACNIIAAVSTLDPELYEGDACKLRDGSDGVCTLSNKCAWFRDNVIKSKKVAYTDVVRCVFDAYDEVVCCKNNLIAGKIDVPNPLRKSEVACNSFPEYFSGISYHIINGESADLGEFPFVAALGYASTQSGVDYEWNCGASLISSSFLLTAAHCLPRSGRPVIARIGKITIDDVDMEKGQDILIKNIIVHPEYRGSKNYNDIGLIELVSAPVLNDNVSPACLYNSMDDITPDTVLSAEGWGVTSVETQSKSAILMKVNLTTVDRMECNKTFFDNNLLKNNRKLSDGIISSQYCARGNRNAALTSVGDTCQGDSGGPLQILKDNKYHLVGVTSFGNGCGSSTPSIYTRVAHYIPWIESVVWP